MILKIEKIYKPKRQKIESFLDENREIERVLDDSSKKMIDILPPIPKKIPTKPSIENPFITMN